MATDFDLVLHGGTVVTGGEAVETDIAIRDGRIAALGRGLRGDEMRDVSGRYVLPGGVDPHCHVEQMTASGLRNVDTFETATRAALYGGTTSIIPFAAQHRGLDLAEVVEEYHALAAKGAMIDYALHMIVTEPTEKIVAEDLPRLIGEGHGSIKVFMTYDKLIVEDPALLSLLAVAREHNALVCVHAENHAMIGWATKQLIGRGMTAPRYHGLSHPREAEIEAVGRLIALAELSRQPVMVFHVSTREALAQIRAARRRGVPIHAETCPHYLYLTEDALDAPGMEAAKWICSPPLRTSDDQQALWDGLTHGDLDLVSSDHAPSRFDETGKLKAGPNASFKEIANGMPGLQCRMPLLFDAAMRGVIDLPQAVALGATNAARIYNLEAKGRLVPGADADIAVWDPSGTTVLSDETVRDATGYTPYPGRELKGAVDAVYLRGTCLLRDGQLLAEPGCGRFLPRQGGAAASWDATPHVA